MEEESSTPSIRPSRRSEQPNSVGYALVFALVAGLTALLVALSTHIPIVHLAAPYILLTTLVAFLLGLGPATLAVVLGMLAYSYFFSPSLHSLAPVTHASARWEGLAELFVLNVGAGCLALLIRRSEQQRTRLATEVAKSREAVERLEVKNELILNAAGEGIIGLSTKGVMTFVNPSAARMLGYDVNDLIGNYSHSLWHHTRADGSVYPANECWVYQAYRDGVSHHISDEVFWKRDGSSFPVDYASTPIWEHGKLVGAVVVFTDTSERRAVEEALQKSFEREQRIAETLQSSLLTQVPEQISDFKFETVYQPAWEEARVGGDFYDVFVIGPDKIGIAVGDVSGKGLSAAAQVAMVRNFVRSHAYEHDSPSTVSEHVNSALALDSSFEGFATVFFGVLDCSARTLTYASSGHSPAILWRQDEGSAVLLGLTGLPYGVMPNASYEEQTIRLSSGDEVLLGTDGLYEEHCGEHYLGLDGLVDIYAHLKHSGHSSAAELVEQVVDLCGSKLRDDVAVLRISVVGQPRQ